MKSQLRQFQFFVLSLDAPAFSLPRHNSSCQFPSELPADLLSARLIWVRCGGLVPPLHNLCDGPYTIPRRGPSAFTLQVKQREEIIAVSRLKACMAADPTPDSPSAVEKSLLHDRLKIRGWN
jgi:hypothetical protein